MSSINPINAAAQSGDLEQLITLRQDGCEWNTATMSHAAQNGNLDCLRYLYNHGCGWDDWATAWAAAGGHHQLTKLLKLAT